MLRVQDSTYYISLAALVTAAGLSVNDVIECGVLVQPPVLLPRPDAHAATAMTQDPAPPPLTQRHATGTAALGGPRDECIAPRLFWTINGLLHSCRLVYST